MYLADKHILRNLVFGSSLLFLLAGCGNKSEAPSNGKAGGPPTLHASGFIVTAKSFNKNYTASGTLLANEQISLHPEITGRVTEIPFKEGSKVSKGDLLLQLYDADIRAQIQKLKAQRSLQLKIQERQQQLLKIGGISQQEYETTVTQIASIDADIAYQEAMLDKTRILAPFNGVIGTRDISPGAIVAPGTLVATLQQTDPLKLDFHVPGQFRNNISIGQPVNFTIAGVSDTFVAKVSVIDPGANAATRTIKIRAMVPNSAGKIIPGSFAHVQINFESSNDALLIPSQAVIPSTRDRLVAVVKDGKAKLTPIQTGVRTQNMVLVESGLQEGDTIITTGIMQVKAGMNIQLKNIVNDQYEI